MNFKPDRRRILNSVAGTLFRGAERYFQKGTDADCERRGAKLGMLFYRLDRKHRERTYSNLRFAFPEWDEAKVDETAKNVFRHFGMVAGDFLRSSIRTNEDVLPSAELIGTEHLDVALRQETGVLAITGHFGNWERIAHWGTASGYPMTVVARPVDDDGLEAKLNAIREKAGVKVVTRGNAVRSMIAELRQNRVVAVLPDQNSDECFVPFFGHPTGTVMGPAVLHLRTGAALLPAFGVRTGVGKYQIILQPCINVDRSETDPEAITTQVNAAIEAIVRQYPEQYLWMHDRWKSARRAGLLGGE